MPGNHRGPEGREGEREEAASAGAARGWVQIPRRETNGSSTGLRLWAGSSEQDKVQPWSPRPCLPGNKGAEADPPPRGCLGNNSGHPSNSFVQLELKVKLEK